MEELKKIKSRIIRMQELMDKMTNSLDFIIWTPESQKQRIIYSCTEWYRKRLNTIQKKYELAYINYINSK
mgnify:CR=1 FL=1